MKKLIIGTVLTVVTVASTFAQGDVLFNNSTVSKVSIDNDGSISATPANASTTATTFYYALFLSTDAMTVLGTTAAQNPTIFSGGSYAFQDPNWILGNTANGPAYGINNTAGKFASSVAGTDDVTHLNNAGIGSADYFTVLGWSANIGSTIASVESFLAGTDPGVTTGFLGESDVSGLITTGITGSTSPVGIFGTTSGLDNPFVMASPAIPEPTTIALGAVGALSLLGLRRKKS